MTAILVIGAGALLLLIISLMRLSGDLSRMEEREEWKKHDKRIEGRDVGGRTDRDAL